MAGFNPYEVMGLKADADGVEIRSAYRRLARSVHPDSGGNAESWAQLKRAYDILNDPAARAHFDATGEAADPQRNPGDVRPMEHISIALGLALTGDKDLLGTDLVKAIKKALLFKRDEHRSFVEKAEAALLRAKRMRNRFRRKTGGANDLEAMLDWHEEQLNEGLRGNKAHVADFTRAAEIIDQYEFDPEGGGRMFQAYSPNTSTSNNGLF